MLRLVHPSPKGQDTRPSSRRKSVSLSLTSDERNRLRAALKNLRRAYGGWDVLASITGVYEDTLRAVAYGDGRGSYGIAVQAARAAGIPVETLLSGRPIMAGACALCGRKGGAS